MLDSLPLGHSYNHSHSTVTATCSSSLLTPCTQRRFVKQDDRKRALVSRLLQYSLVRHVLLIPFRQINICRTPEGKPYLVPLHTLWPIIIPTIIHHRSLQLHPISSKPFCLSGCLVGCIHPLITAGLIYLAAGKLFDFPKLQLQHLASGRLRWNSIRATLPCWPGHRISLQAPGRNHHRVHQQLLFIPH